MRTRQFSVLSPVATVVLMCVVTCGAVAAQPSPGTQPNLDDTTRAAAFRAAGAVQRGGRWLLCPQTPAGDGDASIGGVAGLGERGQLAVIVSGDNVACFGVASNGFRVLERNADGRWRVVHTGAGNARFGRPAGVGGWPDLLLAPDARGCAAVLRWDGNAWRQPAGTTDGGKPCAPGG